MLGTSVALWRLPKDLKKDMSTQKLAWLIVKWFQQCLFWRSQILGNAHNETKVWLSCLMRLVNSESHTIWLIKNFTNDWEKWNSSNLGFDYTQKGDDHTFWLTGSESKEMTAPSSFSQRSAPSTSAVRYKHLPRSLGRSVEGPAGVYEKNNLLYVFIKGIKLKQINKPSLSKREVKVCRR